MTYYMRGFNPFISWFNYGTLKLSAILLAIVAIIILAFTVFRKGKNCGGVKRVIFDFFNFNSLCVGRIIKSLYLIIFLYNTILGCLLLFVNPIDAFMYILVYNLLARVAFEFIMIFIKIEENTRKKCKHNHDDFDEENATLIIEDITDEVIEDMRIAEEEKKKKVKKTIAKTANKQEEKAKKVKETPEKKVTKENKNKNEIKK